MGVGGGGPGTCNAHPYIYIYTYVYHISHSVCDAGGLILAGSDPETGKNHIVIVQITMF